MVNEYKQKKAKFKVVDRRQSSENINIKTEASCEEKNGSKDNASNLNVDDTVDASIKQKKTIQSRYKITFSMFIQSLGHQTFISLGLIPQTNSSNVKINLQQARETIDILQMLREKTKNNLDIEDDKMFGNLLYELKMRFISVQNEEANSKK